MNQSQMITFRFKFWLLAVVTLLMLGMNSAWAGDLDDGLAALNAKNYDKALQLIRPLAEKGAARAQSTLGSIYLNGWGVPVDYDVGNKWARLAAAKGDANGQIALGVSYKRGRGVAIDYAEAVKWFKLSAAKGSSIGQRYLGEMFESGHGVPQDYDEAARWYLKAAAQGNDLAKKKLESTWAMKSAVERVAGPAANTGAQVREASQQETKGKESEQARIAEEARTKEQSRLAQEAKTKEQERLTQEAKAKEQARLAREAKAKDDEVVRLRQQVAKLENGKAGKDQKTVFAHRRALVIGNDSYMQVTKLVNAREDARAIAEGLQKVGYQVTLKLDANEKEMKAALRTFKGQIDGGDEALFFFAGHGVQMGAANYLLPIDVTGENEEQIKDDSIQLQRVLDDMSERKAKFTLAMIDACRDNPFKTAGRAITGGRGLAPTTAATGQMVIFSAGAGQQAMDKLGPTDTNKNGLFTRVFLKEMQRPGVSVDRVVRNVRNEVVRLAKSVGHEQVPAIYDQVVGEFYFRR